MERAAIARTGAVMSEGFLDNADHLWNIAAGIGGAILGAIAVAWREGARHSATSARILAVETDFGKFQVDSKEFRENIRNEVDALAEKHDRTRDQLSAISQNMVQRSDFQDRFNAVQTALASIQSRIDQLITAGHR
jgi:uncharacterized protein involved in exopolysaccharide biosynthesis